MMKKITPAEIMKQIREGVRRTSDPINIDAVHEKVSDENIQNILHSMNEEVKRLNHKITPHMPVAFMEPRLTSRYKLLGKIIVPIRKLGTRLFTKWYADTFSNEQKHLNHEIWHGINQINAVINFQSSLNQKLSENVEVLKNEVEVLINENETLKTRLLEQSEENNKLKIGINALNIKTAELTELWNEKMMLDLNYYKFAQRFSADPKEIKRIYQKYVRYYSGKSNVLDIGCSRGYFLELLSQEGINAYGIDTDLESVEICKAKNLTAYHTDAITHLNNIPADSIDGIFMGHVIEHLNHNEKIKFLKLCHTKLAKNGVMVIETPNTTSSFVMHNLYYLDPTHQQPLLPEALKFIGEMVGFTVENAYLSEEIPESSMGNDYYNFSLIIKK